MNAMKGAFPGRPSRRTLCALVIVLLLGAVACRKQVGVESSKKVAPAPPVEAKGPILSMVMASSIDARGEAVNPRFSFPQSEPQVTAIIYLGKISGSPLNVTWFKSSEDRDEKLFEHQIQVKTDDRAFSVGKNGSGTLAAGAYKVVATLEGQTQEMEWDISPQKASASNGSKSSVGQNTVPTSATDAYQMIAMFDSGVGSQSGVGIPAGSPGGQGQAPVAGSSGTHDWWFTTGVPGTSHYQPPKPPTAEELRICIGGIEGCAVQSVDFTADVVNVYVENPSDQIVYVLGSSADSSSSPIGTVPPATPEKRFLVDPCAFPGPDLPGSKLTFFAQSSSTSRGTTITLGNDTLAPRLKVVSTPARGTKVKAGDKINLKVTAQEKRRNGPWQTGVKVIQITAEPGGLVKDPWVNPANLPKPCAEKTWEQSDEATYTVRKNPPPIIKICALAEDYAGNQGLGWCGEFRTGNKWNGKVHLVSSASNLYGACNNETWDGEFSVVVGANGDVQGKGSAHLVASPQCTSGSSNNATQAEFDVRGTFKRSQFQLVFAETAIDGATGGLANYTFFLDPAYFMPGYSRSPPDFTVPVIAPGDAEAKLSNSATVISLNTRARGQVTITMLCEDCQ